ncbi:MAG: hypothetical protein GX096_07935 [Clostridiales bacterium]|nr:hypothetical protein [Clostridiales bacterium]
MTNEQRFELVDMAENAKEMAEKADAMIDVIIQDYFGLSALSSGELTTNFDKYSTLAFIVEDYTFQTHKAVDELLTKLMAIKTTEKASKEVQPCGK